MLEHALDPASLGELEAHLDSCDHCQQTVAVLAGRSLAAGTLQRSQGELAVGATIGARYELEAELGRGGMGVVHVAHDRTLGRKVALKLHRAGTRDDRLHREAVAMATLAHPNVVTVFEVGQFGDRMFVAMEYVRGGTLRSWLTASKHSWREILALSLDAGAGLAAAHAAGLVHRDFKPENVLVGDDGRPRVSDFGLARGGFVAPAPSGDATTTTETGTVQGTPAYMAPEQLAGERVDARSDQFAFCVTAWECLYGVRPFAGSTIAALHQAIEARQLRGATSAVPAAVRRVLERGLATAPGDRHADLPALLAALRSAAAPRTRKRVLWIAAALVAAGGGGFATVSYVGAKRHAAACAREDNAIRGQLDTVAHVRIRAAFAATRSPLEATAYARSIAVLDRYAAILADGAHTQCAGTAEPAEVTAARRACFADRASELRGMVELMTQADASLVIQAPNASWALFDFAPCDGPIAALSARATSNPADTAELGRVRALLVAGRYAEGGELATKLVAAATASKNRELELAALLVLAQLREETSPPAEVAQLFHRAAALAEELGRDLDAAVAHEGLANLAGVTTHDYVAAHRELELARAKLARLGGENPALDANLLVSKGQILLDENRVADSEIILKRGIALLEQTYGPDDPKVGLATGTLSHALRAQGKPEALATSQRTLQILERAYGSDHPMVAGSQMTLAQAELEAGKLAEARARLGRADAVFVRVYGEIHPVRAAVYGNLGEVERASKQPEAARAAYQRALAILEQTEGPKSPSASSARRDVAVTFADQGRYDEAIAEATRALAILDELGPAGAPRLISALIDLATFELARSRPKRALPIIKRAMVLVEPDDANLAEATEVNFLGARVYWEIGDRSRARDLALLAAATTVNDPARGAEIAHWLAEHRK